MIEQDFSDLTGKILIASPHAMQGSMFYQSLVYVVYHADIGSIGFIINRVLEQSSTISNLLKTVAKDAPINLLDLEIHLGGPLEVERGFFLHSTEYFAEPLFRPEKLLLGVSSSPRILRDISHGRGPEFSIFAIGYTGWDKGQIELEIQNNLWIVTEPDIDVIFGTDINDRWSAALNKIGMDSSAFVPNAVIC